MLHFNRLLEEWNMPAFANHLFVCLQLKQYVSLSSENKIKDQLYLPPTTSVLPAHNLR